jgi:hypothetical protein
MSLARPVSQPQSCEDLAFELDQARLNIENRTRTSRLPWRGQFSPELVEHLIDRVCPESTRILDPFCGSGTVLYESLQKGIDAIGAEVNPAAWHLASLASFAALPADEKNVVLKRVRRIISDFGFWGSGAGALCEGAAFLRAVSSERDLFLRKALAAVVLLGMGDGQELTTAAIAHGGFAVTSLLSSLHAMGARAECHLADARCLPIEDQAVDAAITSPPYINVFNYHQNYRPAAEMLGWSPLEAARSEIGANRKHRANRFLTVVQYSLDMAQCLAELSRVMKRNAPLVIVVGRTSNVLGVAFENGGIIAELIRLSQGFSSLQTAERFFTNRYGERIYEDILITRCLGASTPDLNAALEVGIRSLVCGRPTVAAKNRSALDAAIQLASEVRPSPLLSVTMPDRCPQTQSNVGLAHAGD